mgnify:CR=1 FL=1
MFLQNLRAKVGARLNGDKEAGFTLIELLVVMLILGILAAIALPAFFNQRDKAGDAEAKEIAHTTQVALESCSTDYNGTYPVAAGGTCEYADLRADYEETLPAAAVTVTGPGCTASTSGGTSTSRCGSSGKPFTRSFSSFWRFFCASTKSGGLMNLSM